MRTLGLVLLCLALAACGVSPPNPPAVDPVRVTVPPVKPPLPPPGPRKLHLVERGGGGWVLEATAESQTGNDVLGSPLGIWWTAADRALVRWLWPDMASEFHLIDLATGTMQPAQFDDIRSLSPDGRYVTDHLRGLGGTVLREAETGKEVWRAPSHVAGAVWLSPTLLHLWLESGRSLLYRVETGETVEFPTSFRPVPLAGGEACYRTQVSQQVACTTLDGQRTRLLTPEKHSPEVHQLPDGFAADPSGRHLAFVYAAPKVSWWRASVAYALTPAIYSWVDTLGIYNGATGSIVRHALPRAGIPTAPVWSPDGALLGFGLRQMEGQGYGVRPTGQTEFFVLEVRTGKLTKVGAADGKFDIPRLFRVFGDGRLALQLGYEEPPQVMAPGGKLSPWRPGMEMLKGSDIPAFQGSGTLAVLLPDGEIHTWNWEGGGGHGIVSVAPHPARWAAVTSHSPGRVVFLKR